ncbi:MAG TPA: Smr/MutS family protein [Allosphingosinicella sp.]|nr:Smr/MutS family protein [Allosphingosinicella sp.]
MRRRLHADERALWAKVVATVRPLDPQSAPLAVVEEKEAAPAPPPRAAPRPAAAALRPRKVPGATLDGTWDRRLSRGLVSPDATVDLHGHNLETAHSLLDRRLDEAIGGGARVLLLITGKPPSDERRPVRRGAIRAAVGDWLAASRHAGDIAAVRGAHPRHGGQGALYIVLRRKREP